MAEPLLTSQGRYGDEAGRGCVGRQGGREQVSFSCSHGSNAHLSGVLAVMAMLKGRGQSAWPTVSLCH